MRPTVWRGRATLSSLPGNANELLKYTDKFDDPNMPGEMQVSITFRKVIGGNELKITQEGIPEAIPVEMCYLGWPQSLSLMTKLVESDIPDGN